MKLGKGTLLAIIESALFTLGAIFFLLALMIPATPIWMLIVGFLCGLAGAILWLYPTVARAISKLISNRKSNIANIADIAQKIQGADADENNTYELHRSDSYDNLTDEYIKNNNHDSSDK